MHVVSFHPESSTSIQSNKTIPNKALQVQDIRKRHAPYYQKVDQLSMFWLRLVSRTDQLYALFSYIYNKAIAAALQKANGEDISPFKP